MRPDTYSILAGFPGVGKSTLSTPSSDGTKLIPVDSDSSGFDKSQFPANYIRHIQEQVSYGRAVLVSTHAVVRQALIDARMRFLLVFPDRSLKEEYQARYLGRSGFNGGSNFAELIGKHWDTWIDECEAHAAAGFPVIRLQADQYLADVVEMYRGDVIQFVVRP